MKPNLKALFITLMLGVAQISFGQGMFENEPRNHSVYKLPKFPKNIALIKDQSYFGAIFSETHWQVLAYTLQGKETQDLIEYSDAVEKIGQKIKFNVQVFRRPKSGDFDIVIQPTIEFTGFEEFTDGIVTKLGGYQDKMIFKIFPSSPDGITLEKSIPQTNNNNATYNATAGWSIGMGFDAGGEISEEGPVGSIGLSGSIGYNYSISSGTSQNDFTILKKAKDLNAVQWEINMKNVYSRGGSAPIPSTYTLPMDIVQYEGLARWLKNPPDMAISTAVFEYFAGFTADSSTCYGKQIVFKFETEQRVQYSEIYERSGFWPATFGGQFYNEPVTLKVVGRIIIDVKNKKIEIIYDDEGLISLTNPYTSGASLEASDAIKAFSNSSIPSGNAKLSPPFNLETAASTFNAASNVSVVGNMLNDLRELTVEAWVYGEEGGGEIQAILSASGLEFIHFQTSANPAANNAVYFEDGSSLMLPVIPKITGGWHHVAMVLKSGDSRVYLDGEIVGTPNTKAFSKIKPAGTFFIGKGWAGERLFSGKIAGVKIWNRALRTEEFNSGLDETVAAGLIYYEPVSSLKVIGDGRNCRMIEGTNLPEWNSVTMEAWVRAVPNKDIQAIVSAFGPEFVHFQASDDPNAKNAVYFEDGSSLMLPVIPLSKLSEWTHVAIVVESGNSRVYLNGKQVGETNTTTFSSKIKPSSDVFIGKGWEGGRVFNGYIADVRVWKNRPLTQSQISTYMNTPPPNDADGLIFHQY